MTEKEIKAIEEKCREFRIELIELLHRIQTGHPGGSLSCCEIVTALYHGIMNIDPQNPKKEDRDHFILSKGHAAPMLYLNLADRGYFDKEKLSALRQLDSMLQGHPCAHKTPGVELSAGPLGLGLGAGLGMALANRKKGIASYTYVLLGDGEIQEGAVWEAAMAASKFQADHLIAILDYNGVQLDGTTEEIMPLGDVKAKWTAFGWETQECGGHDVRDFIEAVNHLKEKEGKPGIILAKTVKGKGVDFMEGKNSWHGKAIDEAAYEAAMKCLKGEAS